VLRSSILPELERGRRIRAWSAGCSYGAEAYSLAALGRTVAPGAQLSIDATDIDERVLARAREGWFSAEDARTAPADELRRHFEQVDGGWRASAELRRMVSFSRDDLLRARPAMATYDLILCRNVVIYFNEDAREQVHATLAGALRPGGYLVIGSTERVTQKVGDIDLETVRPFIYRKLQRAA
jgi:chemotaxis protein methyltransferase CheR